MKIMKKSYLTPLFVLLAAFFFPMTAAAGDLNSAEQGIISAISATYEYNGAYYKVTDGYISQVSDYLSQDGVDLSEDEASGYIEQFYANIGTGISSGYMVKVGDVNNSKQPQTQETGQEAEETETDTETETALDKGNTKTGNEKSNAEDKKAEKESQTETEMETETRAEAGNGSIVDKTAGSTQSGKLEYTVTPMEAVMYVWDTDSLDVYAAAYKDSEIIGTLSRGDEVSVTGAATTGWAQIDFNGETGYVSAVYLRTDGYMSKIEKETETGKPDTGSEIETRQEQKDYSNAKPLAKKIDIEVLALGIAAIMLIASSVIVLLHKNKNKKR